jgi:hypothetical protein
MSSPPRNAGGAWSCAPLASSSAPASRLGKFRDRGASAARPDSTGRRPADYVKARTGDAAPSAEIAEILDTMLATSRDFVREGFKKFVEGQFEYGLSLLNKDPNWFDDRDSLDGPFFLGFPNEAGWGEALLLASLLKRHAEVAGSAVKIFANQPVCSILHHEAKFDCHVVAGTMARRSVKAPDHP